MKRFFALLLAALLVVSFAACGKTAVSEPNDVSSEQPETPVVSEPSEPEAPSTSVPEEPEAPAVFNPEDLPRPNEISEEGSTKAIWSEEDIEYSKSIGFDMLDEEAALYWELADTLNQHLSLSDDDVAFPEDDVIALETALIEAYESSNTGQGKWAFSQMCSQYFLCYQAYEPAISYGEISLDELWANGEWFEKFHQGELDALYMDMVYIAYLFVSDVYAQYGDLQKALECCYGTFDAYNQAGMPMPRSKVMFVLEVALYNVQSVLDPSYLSGAEDELARWQDNLEKAIAESGEDSDDAMLAQLVVAEEEADLARAQEAVAIAPELIEMIQEDIEEYSA